MSCSFCAQKCNLGKYRAVTYPFPQDPTHTKMVHNVHISGCILQRREGVGGGGMWGQSQTVC